MFLQYQATLRVTFPQKDTKFLGSFAYKTSLKQIYGRLQEFPLVGNINYSSIQNPSLVPSFSSFSYNFCYGSPSFGYQKLVDLFRRSKYNTFLSIDINLSIKYK